MRYAVAFLRRHRLSSLLVGLGPTIGLLVFNWLRVKTGLALAMEAIGINWTNPQAVSDGDKLNFVVGLGIGLVGVSLGAMAFRLTSRQQRILEKQDEIMQAEIARETKVSPWAFYDDVPKGWFGLTVWGWSVAPVVITEWKLIIRMDEVSEVTIIESATNTPLPVETYAGPFMPPGAPVNWQVVGRTPITIPAGDNNYVRFAIGRIVRAAQFPGDKIHISYEMTTRYRKYLGIGHKDGIAIEPRQSGPLDNP